MVHVSGQRAAVAAAVTVPVTVVTVARHGAVRGHTTVAGHAVRQRAVAGQGTVAGQRAVALYRAVAVVMGMMGMAVAVRVVTAFFLLGYLLYGQEPVFPHLYPFCHVPDGSVFCTQTFKRIILSPGNG